MKYTMICVNDLLRFQCHYIQLIVVDNYMSIITAQTGQHAEKTSFTLIVHLY